MQEIRTNDIFLACERFRARDDTGKRPLVLIRGLGSQRVQWSPSFIDYFAATRDVVIFDNRDVGRSQRFDAAGVPDLSALAQSLKAGETVAVAYDVSDMARDVVGLMDALGIAKADVLGMSMGGIIVQHLAFDHATRIGSAVCVMSLAGNRALPAPKASELSAPALDDAAAFVDYLIAGGAEDEGRLFPNPPEERRRRAEAAVENGYSPYGITRQIAATVVDGDRRVRLQSIEIPFMVIHGTDDKLILPECGADVAAQVPHAVYLPVEGMGHDIALGMEAVLGPPILAFLDGEDAAT